jgi:phage-related protein
VGGKPPLSFTLQKQNSYQKSSEKQVTYKKFGQGFSCRRATEPQIKKGLEKGVGLGGQKKFFVGYKVRTRTVPTLQQGRRLRV